MNTRISSKFAAAALALMINSLMIGGVAVLFSAQIRTANAAPVLAASPSQTAADAAV